MKIFKQMIKISTLVLAGCLVWVALSQQPAHAAYDNNHIMDDGVFDNSGTMSQGSIQNFFSQFPSSCLTGYQAPYPNDYFNYGGNVPSSQVIRRAADLWGINPQVLVVTLEKEESLVRGNAGCDGWRYNSAMGYGCTDGGTCPPAAYAGFSKQVTKGAWQLKFNKERAYGNTGWDGDDSTNYYGYMTQGNRKRCGTCANIYYDGWATIDGTAVHMDNGTTASLYSYTPHFHGNQNFVMLFEAWFGSTYGTGGPPLPPFAHPDGTLIRSAGTSGVYLVEASTLRPITSPAILYSNGWNFNQVRIATTGDMALTVANPVTLREGTLLKGSSPAIYVVDYLDNGTIQKRGIASWAVFTGLGYHWNEVLQVSDGELPAQDGSLVSDVTIHPDGTLIRSTGSPGVYLVTNSQKQPIPSLAIFTSQGYSWDRVKVATTADTALADGPAINYREGTLLKGSSPAIYVVDYLDNGTIQKRGIPTADIFIGLSYHWNEVLQVSDGELPAQDGSPIGS